MLNPNRKYQDFSERVPDYTRQDRWHSSFIPGDLRQLVEVGCIYNLMAQRGFPQAAESTALLKEERPSVLDVGCGCGYSSRIWASVARSVYAFDISEIGIQVAKREWSDLSNVKFFTGNGIEPESIPELQDVSFDLCLMREFHPFTRFLTVDGEPIDHVRVIEKYLAMLNPEGACIIWHRLPRSLWREKGLLDFSRVVNHFPNTYGPVDIRLFLPYTLSKVLRLSKLLKINPTSIYPLLSRLAWQIDRRPSKLVVIQKGR